MEQKKEIEVFSYERVSTVMQVDGYSLDAQRERIEGYARLYGYRIVAEYRDEGRSGKSIEGREGFQKMLEDIACGKYNVKYVIVYKLSRFGRNIADIMNSIQRMEDYGVHLICVEEGIDSSKGVGKLLISVLSAVAEIERENILVQTMEGRKQKARQGKWNGGFAPYGYKLENGKLIINEEEALAVRTIFDKYINTNMGINRLAHYLEQQGIKKIPRQNGTKPLFSAGIIKEILDNPVYCGKIAYGRRRTEKVQGTRNEYHIVKKDEYIISEGEHEGIIDEEIWEKAQSKRKVQAKKYERINRGKDERIHLLTGLVKCPVCGAGMYGNKSIKRRDGKKYKDYFYYGCKHRRGLNGEKCQYNKQIHEEKLNSAVQEVISKMVSNPKFAKMIQQKINLKVDTTEIDKEIAGYKRQCQNYKTLKNNLERQMDTLDIDDKYFEKKYADLQKRIDSMYEKIEDAEKVLQEAKMKKQAIMSEMITGENIYKLLISFDRFYDIMSEGDKRDFLMALISEIQIHEDKQENGQWLKSIKFNFPMIQDDGKITEIGLDNFGHNETVVGLQRKDM